MEETIFPYLSSRLKNISAYKAKDQESNLIYLDKNELSFDILPQDHPELFESLQKIKLNRYPELAGDSLRQRIANKYHIHPGSIMLGNGSDDIINIILSACRPTSRPAWIAAGPGVAPFVLIPSGVRNRPTATRSRPAISGRPGIQRPVESWPRERPLISLTGSGRWR